MQLTILGTGNVATALGNSFHASGHEIIQVYDRKRIAAKKLSKEWNAEGIDTIKKLKTGSDVYLLCLSDDAITEVAEQFTNRDTLCVHTSGAVPLQVLKKYFDDCGVLYPLQTISANRKINFTNIPLCIEASNKHTEKKLKDLAKSISNHIHFVNSQQRIFLHLAAVFANNFTNSLYASAATLLEEQNLSFRILRPLILETAMKAIELDPHKAQTGPAIRNDKLTIEKHLQLLQPYPELKKIYELMTEQIQQQQKK